MDNEDGKERRGWSEETEYVRRAVGMGKMGKMGEKKAKIYNIVTSPCMNPKKSRAKKEVWALEGFMPERNMEEKRGEDASEERRGGEYGL